LLDKPEELETGPYIGPRPFERNDRNLFFARDRETIQIVSLILSNPLTLVYSQSGVGKTSLFNAKILHELEEQYKFETFPSARVRSLLTPDKIPEEVYNVYMLNALQSLEPDISLETLKNYTLSSFLKEYSAKTTVVKYNKSAIPRVIVFDQLEELFNLYPENWNDQQRDFFQQIAEALNEDPMLRIVMVIREEYLAHLSAFAYLLPGRLRARFRLERLDKQAALLAVTEPLKQTGCSFAPGVAEKLVNDLLTMRVENIFGKIVNVKGEYVEPVHLQVVCQRLWMKIIASGITEITQEYLKGSADINKALTELYLDAISDAAKQTGVKEDAIRRWFGEKLITSSGTRGIVHREAKSTGGIPNGVVDVLQGRYLIRQEWHSGSRWYELTHDRLIEPILESNKEWKQSRQKKKNRYVIITMGLTTAAIVVAVIVVSAYYYSTYTPPPTLIIDQRTVPVGIGPNSVAINPNTNLLYVTHRLLNITSVINGTTNSVVADIAVGKGPISIAINPNTNLIYVANYNSHTVSVIDGTTNSVVADIAVGRRPWFIAINPNTNLIYVSNLRSNTLSIIDGTTNSVVTNIPVGTEPSSIAINPNTNLIYVANFRSQTVSVIDGTTNSVVADIAIGGNLRGEPPIRFIAINPNTNLIYASNRTSHTLSVINGTTNSVVADIAVKGQPEYIAINPNTNLVYVTQYWADSVSIIDGTTNSVVTNIPVGIAPNNVAINPNTSTIYVTNVRSNTISVIDLIRTQTNQCFLIECLLETAFPNSSE
jgi:YVTN family beta-propeller protein